MKEELVLLTWPDYVAPQTLAAFERETDLPVRLEIVPSAVEMVERMGREGLTPDLLCPPDYAVRELAARGLLLGLDEQRLPNLANLFDEFRFGRAHDPGGAVSVAKDWGTTGLVYRTDRIEGAVKRWDDLWETARRFPGRVTLLDSSGEVIGAALQRRAHSYNSVDPADLAQARLDLLELRSHLLNFTTDHRPLLGSGQAWLSLGWNGDAAALQRQHVPIGYAIPEEGSQIWEDDWAISAATRHPEAAHAFLDFVLRPEIARQEALYTGYACPNRAGFGLLPVEVQTDPTIYPPSALRERLERGLPLDSEGAQRRAELWSEIRTPM